MGLELIHRSRVVRRGMVCLVVALVAGCTHGSKQTRAGDRQAEPVTQQTGLEAAALANFLPATHSDLQVALPLRNFYGSVAAKLISSCLRRHGFELQYPNVPETYNWSDANSLFPDLDRIASDGIATPSDLTGERDWEPDVPETQRQAFDKVVVGCQHRLGRTVRSGSGFWIALQRRWVNVDAKDDADPKYLRLVGQFAACVERRGYQAATPTSFLLGVDRLIAQSRAAGKPASDQQEISLRTGRVYAECYRAANAYRQKLRRRARAQFLDQYALEIQAAQRQLDTTVERLSREMGVTYQAGSASS